MKRGAEHQITKDEFERDAGEENEDGINDEDEQGFAKASAEVMKSRRVVKVKRQLSKSSAPTSSVPADKPNPFASFSSVEPSPAPLADKSEVTVTEQAENRQAQESGKDREGEDLGGKESLQNENAPQLSEEVPQGSLQKQIELKKGSKLTDGVSKLEESSAVTEKGALNSEDKNTANNAARMCDSESATDLAKPSEQGSAVNVIDKGASQKDEPPIEPKDSAMQAEAPGQIGNAVEPAKMATQAVESSQSNPEPKSETETLSNGVSPTKKTPFVFGGTAGNGMAVSFADAAAADQSAGRFSFNVPVFLEAEKPKEAAPSNLSSSARKFSETPVMTGEEEEFEAFRARGKLYGLEMPVDGSLGKWKEKGVGAVKVNVHEKTKRARILMRTEATLRLKLNAPLFPELKIDRASERSVRFHCMNTEDSKKASSGSFLVRFASKDDADQLIAAVEQWKRSSSQTSGKGE